MSLGLRYVLILWIGTGKGSDLHRHFLHHNPRGELLVYRGHHFFWKAIR